MNETLPPTSDHSVDRLIADYLQAVEAGKVPSREELLAQHPDHAEELRRFFADFDRVDRGAASLRVVGPNTSDYADTPPGTLPRVRYFGDYELLEEIARGGMGIVYKARQVSLSRLVALKMLLKGEHATDKDAARFQAEAEAAAGLDHPNIVPIYEIGTHEGRQYLAMKFIEGKSLAKVDRSDARTEAARLLTIAKAVHFAHQRGVLHRDLKPGNILVDDAGIHYVADFGLAKRVDAQVSLSETGDVIGTPRYMAPEQANGKKGLTTAVDTYALGVILYERLTGKTPHQGQTLLEILRQLREEEPAKPRSLMPTLDRDLETICVKCLEKEPGQRYATTGELAEELERWVNGEPIQARPVGQMERAWRWCKRNPVVSGLSAGIAALLLTATIVSLLLSSWALGEKSRADKQMDLAVKSRDNAERYLVGSFLRPLGYGDYGGAEIRALVELSELKEDRLRLLFLEEMLNDPDTAARFLNRSEAGVQASIGTSPRRRLAALDLVARKLKEQSLDWNIKAAACCVSLELGGTGLPKLDQELLEILLTSSKLKLLLERVDAEQHVLLARTFATQLQSEITESQTSMVSIGFTECVKRLDALKHQKALQEWCAVLVTVLKRASIDSVLNVTTAIVTCTDKLDSASAQQYLQESCLILIALLEREKVDGSQESMPSRCLVQCISRLEVNTGQDILKKCMTALIAILARKQGKEDHLLVDSCECLLECIKRINTTTSQSELKQCSATMISLLPQENNTIVDRAASQILMACVERLDTRTGQGLLQKACANLITQLQRETKGSVLNGACVSLSIMIPHLDKSAHSLLHEGIKALIALLKKAHDTDMMHDVSECLRDCVVTLSGNIARQLLNETSAFLITLLQREKGHVLRMASEGMVACAASLDPEAANLILEQSCAILVDRMQQDKERYFVQSASEGLGVLTARLDSNIKQRLMNQWRAALSEHLLQNKHDRLSREKMRDATKGLIEYLVRLDQSTSQIELNQWSDTIIDRLQFDMDAELLKTMSEGLVACMVKLDPATSSKELKELSSKLLVILHREVHQYILTAASEGLVACLHRLDAVSTQRIASEAFERIINAALSDGRFSNTIRYGDANLIGCLPHFLRHLTNRHQVAEYLKHPACIGDIRIAVLCRLEELCLGLTKQQWQWTAVTSINTNPMVSAVSAIASSVDRYTQRRFRITWDAVEWFQKNDPTFDWEARPSKVAR